MPGCSSRSRASRRARAEARRLADWFHRKFHDEVTSYLVDEKVFRRFGPQSASPNMEAMRAGHENLRYHLSLYRPSRRDAELARGRCHQLRRSRRGGASVGARLSRRSTMGGARGGEELVCAAEIAAVVQAAVPGSRRGLHPVGDLCRPRFLSFDSSYRRKPVSRVQNSEQVTLDSGLRRNDGAR